MAGAEATRGGSGRLVTITALVVALVFAYYYWNESGLSGEMIAQVEKLSGDQKTSNNTIKDLTMTVDAMKEQIAKLEGEKKAADVKVTEGTASVTKLTADVTKLTADVKKVTDEKAESDKKLGDAKQACEKSCEERVNQAKAECTKKPA